MNDSAFIRRAWLVIPVLLALAASRALGEAPAAPADPVAAPVSPVAAAPAATPSAPTDGGEAPITSIGKDAAATATAPAAAKTYAAGSEIAVILSRDRFYPSEIRIRSGIASTLVFSSVNRKPAALVIEPSALTRKAASTDEATPVPQTPAEITRELSNDRVTTIAFDLPKGTYGFHDALGGGRGEIIVE